MTAVSKTHPYAQSPGPSPGRTGTDLPKGLWYGTWLSGTPVFRTLGRTPAPMVISVSEEAGRPDGVRARASRHVIREAIRGKASTGQGTRPSRKGCHPPPPQAAYPIRTHMKKTEGARG